MNITVYLGANAGNDPALRDAVRALGRWIGESGNALVYGGSRSGLMGLLADSVLAAGGQVTGVEPRFFVEQELQHNGLTELIVTENMAQRKAKMIELGDAFVALPGGVGTLEEISEIFTRVRLDMGPHECFLLNIDGFYDPLRLFLQSMVERRFFDQCDLDRCHFPRSVEELERRLRGRGTETEDSIRERLATAQNELAEQDNFAVSYTHLTLPTN